MAELQRLQQDLIPAGRQLLCDNHGNLGKVADYCESNYVQASDKKKALEETMAYSTQSLASVTYQISNLATSFLKMLDLQAAELRKVEADINCMAQLVDMHKEKVCRREIGSLTIPKRFPASQKIVSPATPPSLEPYYRKPLSFSVLDDIGHGIKDHSTQLSRTGTLLRKGIKASLTATGTLGRGPRIPEPIQPPVVPEGKLPTASSSSSSSSLLSISSSGAPGPAGDSVPAPPLPPSSSVPPALAPVTVPLSSPPLPGDVPLLGDLPPPLLGDLPPPEDLPPLPLGDLPPPEDLPPQGDPPTPADLKLLPPGDLPRLEDLPLPPPGDLPPSGDLDLPPLSLLPPAPDDSDSLPPPLALPQMEDLALPLPPASEEPPWAPESYLEKVVSLYPYTRQKDNELSFAAGALLYVTRRYSDGWCEGVAGGQAGFFPGNYVEPFC